jgi:Holliday junction resolvase RusA-like endonuclease
MTVLMDTSKTVGAELDILGSLPVAGGTLVIRVPGKVTGKQRPRFSRKNGRAYTPEQTTNMEAHVKQCAIQDVGQPCMVGALAVAIEVGVPIPVSWPKRKQTQAASGMLRPTAKPDLDNIIKLVCDALNEIVWRDDAQIVAQVATKHYALVPETVIRVRAA